MGTCFIQDDITGQFRFSSAQIIQTLFMQICGRASKGPWENGAWNGRESGLFKSIDGGTTWKN
jgi:hypothetical protein